ncbi:hypothetical protein [Salarchaeum sp. JOR-1]|uniref:hypothetical protein n=1 Tax=Salarchaeum sp. JOR-1 TaxID=2599399 RepID=UPI0011987364|nr:hypothetical protein [Salarchaeum sp. JOR-1]QDX40797.1 hypothetical protein FQU85_07705 [Salarchaeum sp. JOR-1]
MQLRTVAVLCLLLGSSLSVGVGSTAAGLATTSTAIHPTSLAPINNTTNNNTSTSVPTPVPTSASRASTQPTPPILINYSIDRTPDSLGTVQVTATVTPPPNLVNLTFYLGAEQTILQSTGIQHIENKIWAWNDSLSSAITVTYRVAVNSSMKFGVNRVETDSWAFLGTPQVTLRYGYSYYPPNPDRQHELLIQGAGYVTPTPDNEPLARYLLLGPYNSRTAQTPSQTFHYVWPRNTTLAMDPSRALGILTNLSTAFNVSAKDPRVSVFSLPHPIRGGGASYNTSLWISASTPPTSDVLYHEYVHSRQSFPETTAAMAWLIEGSASYYSHYLAWQLGNRDLETFRDRLVRGVPTDAVLATTAQTTDAAYEKGALVLAKLDIRIRNKTNGRYTLMDVFRRLNTITESQILSVSRFQATITNVTGVSVNKSVNRYVTTRDTPTLPTHLEHLYTRSDTNDSTIPVNTTIPEAIAGADRVVQIQEFLTAIQYWKQTKSVPGTNQVLSLYDFLTLVELWKNETPV